MLRHEAAIGGALGGESEQRTVQRVETGGGETDLAKAEREDRVLRVAGVVVNGPVRVQQREVRQATEHVMERAEKVFAHDSSIIEAPAIPSGAWAKSG